MLQARAGVVLAWFNILRIPIIYILVIWYHSIIRVGQGLFNLGLLFVISRTRQPQGHGQLVHSRYLFIKYSKID